MLHMMLLVAFLTLYDNITLLTISFLFFSRGQECVCVCVWGGGGGHCVSPTCLVGDRGCGGGLFVSNLFSRGQRVWAGALFVSYLFSRVKSVQYPLMLKFIFSPLLCTVIFI